MALKAKKPDEVVKRLKLFLYGEAGVGKTLASLQFPQAYVIDTERGTDNYAETVAKAGSVVLQTGSLDEVTQEVRELLTTPHEYRTLVIDPITQLYNNVQEKWNGRFDADYKNRHGKASDLQDWGMRYWGKVKSDYKAFQRLLLNLDMNIIVTSHQKDVYQNNSKVGVTFDSMKGDDYFFDYVFRLIRRSDDKRVALTIKERADMGAAKFPPEFEWSYENFCKLYGRESIERKATTTELATPEQVKELEQLLEVVKIEPEVLTKWKEKADCDEWIEFPKDKLQKCIDLLKAKLEALKPEAKEAEKKGGKK